jgi:hypothetical protein
MKEIIELAIGIVATVVLGKALIELIDARKFKESFPQPEPVLVPVQEIVTTKRRLGTDGCSLANPYGYR